MSKYSVKKPMTIFVAVIIIIALGIVSLTKMTPDLLPSMDLPYVVVMTSSPGSTPEEIETVVTKPLEQSLSTLENLKTLQSVSNANYSLIILEFETDASMDTAMINILQGVDLVQGAWDDSIGDPYIMKINPSMMPIAVAAVDMKDSNTEELSNFVKNELMNDLEGITGVASISTGGLLESKVNVNIDEDKIEKLNEKLLNEASPSLADAKAQVNSGLKKIKETEAQVAQQKTDLDKTKEETYDQMAEASANLDAAIAQASAMATQLVVLEGQKAAIEAQISEGSYGDELGVSLSDLQTQLKDTQLQLAVLQTNSTEANAQVEQLKEAYKEAERGTYTAKDNFDAAYAQIDSVQSQLASQKESLNSTMEQLNSAGNDSLQASGLGSMITVEMVSGVLQGQNFSMPAGYVQKGTAKYLVSVGDKFGDTDEIKDLLLFNIEGIGDVNLKDVADVYVSDNSDAVYASINGNPGVLLTFSKQSNYATATVSGNIEKKFSELSDKYPELTFTTMMNQGDYIYLIIGSIAKSLGWGALFAVLILLIFLRDIKPTFITLLSIPISVTFAIVLMYFSGVTLNMISLSGLAVAVGMLVDNSIVVIENIFRLRREGIGAKKAAVAGAKQVGAAITSSTLTTVCVFAPIVFVQGITRQLFTDMALTITFALLASLIIALTLVPAMASMMFIKEPKSEGRGFEGFKNFYRKLLRWNLKNKAIILLIAIILLGYSVYASVAKGFIFIPDMATPQLSGTVTLTGEDVTIEDTKAIGDEILSRIQKVEGVETAGGMLSTTSNLTGETDSSSISLYVIVDQEAEVTGKVICDNIEKACADLECDVQMMSSSSITSYTSALGGSGVTINVYGTDTEKLQKAAEIIAGKLEDVEGIDSKTIDNGLSETEPEIHFVVDNDKAMEKGLTVAQVYMQVSQALNISNTPTTIDLGSGEEDIIVTKGEESNLTPKFIKNLELEGTDKDGQAITVKLKDIAKVEERQTLQSINRMDQRTYITVSGQLKDGYNITLVTSDAEKVVDQAQLPENISVEFSGENQTIMDAMKDLLTMMALGVLLVYLIMVAQFQSLKSPFIIMFTIPLAFTGGLLALLIFDKEISIIAMIGLIMLVGIIVNNGIVMVDYINQLRAMGMAKKDAIVEAGATRMRPVLMTSITTILGLIVMAIGKTAGTDMMQPVALVCIGGLTYATLLTLLVVPVLYDLFNGEKYKVTKKADLDVSDIIAE